MSVKRVVQFSVTGHNREDCDNKIAERMAQFDGGGAKREEVYIDIKYEHTAYPLSPNRPWEANVTYEIRDPW